MEFSSSSVNVMAPMPPVFAEMLALIEANEAFLTAEFAKAP
jgi:hypothetical protein